MITFEKFRHNSEKRTKTKVKSLIKIVFYSLLTISVVKAQKPSTPTVSKYIFHKDILSFCVHGKCTVVFSSGTSISLPLDKFYTYRTEYVIRKNIVDEDLNFNSNNFDLNEQNNSEKWLDNDKEFNTNSATSPANEMDATEHTHTSNCKMCDELNALDDLNDTELANDTTSFEKENLTSFSLQKEHKIQSRSISDDSIKDSDTSADCSKLTWIDDDPNKTNQSESTTKQKCQVQDPKSISGDASAGPNYAKGKSTNSSTYATIKPQPIESRHCETDDSWDDDDNPRELNIQVTPDGFSEKREEAKKMQDCAKRKTEKGMVCVCNASYCDKSIPPDQTPPWMYTWYTSSEKGHRFRKRRNDLTPYKGDEDGAFYVNTSQKYQKIIGFGGTFTDASCKLIRILSKETKKNLLEAYFGPFGINYKLGRVPIGGTDFSPRFYTYIDTMDESMSTFMLTEQDFKYKIPILLESIELTHKQLKLIGSAWSAPLWMKTVPQEFSGCLQRKYFSVWADYHIKFLDQYLRNGVKFWAISTGNGPMNYYNTITDLAINAMEWTPYEQSQWVGYYLYPRLLGSNHSDILMLAFDENRKFAEFYMKYFFGDYTLEYFEDETFIPNSKIIDSISGIQLHGYMDHKNNLPYLQRTKDTFPDKFFLYSERSCGGKPEIGGWTCAETYATGIIMALNHWAEGWIDWNMALNTSGGPAYVNTVLDSPILVDVKKDEFYKQPMFYMMGHVSLFILPNSYRVETKTPEELEEIYAVAAVRSDEGKVIVFYNKYEKNKQVTFIIDRKYKLSIEAPKKSMNSVLFW